MPIEDTAHNGKGGCCKVPKKKKNAAKRAHAKGCLKVWLFCICFVFATLFALYCVQLLNGAKNAAKSSCKGWDMNEKLFAIFFFCMVLFFCAH